MLFSLAMFPGFSHLLLAFGLTLKPYVPPTLEADPTPLPASTIRIEVTPTNEAEWDAAVFARPTFMAPLVGNVARGARLNVRGQYPVEDRVYCPTGLYYALEPQGWICSADTKPTIAPATQTSVLEIENDAPVPYRYVMVRVPEGTTLPMWDSVESLESYATPERELGRGDTLALSSKRHQFDGKTYYLTVDGKVVPVEGTYAVTKFSEWRGVALAPTTHFPFAWVTPKTAPVYDAINGKKLEELAQRTFVDVLEEVLDGKTRWLKIGDRRYMKADHLNEVRKIDRPEGTGTHQQWIDIDLGEQVVVAYRGAEPVFATLTSSGRGPNHTPMGNYPVWGKSSAITMKSQDYDDSPYYVNRVPWVMFFQAHNALHAAYWHDRFGTVKSHGCANLSPRDAHYLFDWLEPVLPPGWTSVRYLDLTQAPHVHVRNSRRARGFFQERNIGPPDKDDEAQRLEQALRRRQAKEQADAAARGPQGPLLVPTTPVNPAPLVPQISPLIR